MWKQRLALGVLLGYFSLAAQEMPPPAVVPAPAECKRPILVSGEPTLIPAYFNLGVTPAESFHDLATRRVAEQIAAWVNQHPPLTSVGPPEKVFAGRRQAMKLAILPDSALGQEGYRLKIDRFGVELTAATPNGLFYGFQTLKQLWTTSFGLPCVDIVDKPRFAWRGMHLDVSRHFFDKAFVKRYIDLLAAHKLNVLHWHLVDGPGWRIEIRKYPKLTEIGAWRVDKRNQPWDWRATELCFEGKTDKAYGGCYTQDDIREIVQYAKERFVTIIPEIEMPGHSYAALVAYPELACHPDTIRQDGLRGMDTFCAGNEKTFTFLNDVLDEVAALFPDAPYIHVGGDEVSPAAWQHCPKCQAKMNELGLKKAEDLQPYFMGRIATHLAAKKRQLIGWDEIAAGKLPADAAVMVWRDPAVVRQVVGQGHPVVLAPGSHLYFDQAQRDPKTEPPNGGGLVTLEKVYSFEPVPTDLPEAQQKLILGVEACLWTEHVQTPEQAEYMLLPRLCAHPRNRGCKPF
jgi:hexosaminidase